MRVQLGEEAAFAGGPACVHRYALNKTDFQDPTLPVVQEASTPLLDNGSTSRVVGIAFPVQHSVAVCPLIDRGPRSHARWIAVVFLLLHSWRRGRGDSSNTGTGP